MADDIKEKRKHALSLLGLSEDASADIIKAKYTDQFNNYQMLLTNAPNPRLKTVYQKNLQELEDVKGILFESDPDALSGLPSVTPIFGQTEEPGPAPAPRPNPNLQKKKNQKEGGIGPVGFAGWGVAVLAIAAAVYFLNIGQQKDAQIAVIEGKLKSMEASAWLNPYFENGIFELESSSNETIFLNGLIVTYSKDGRMEKFYKQFSPSLQLEPGKSLKLKEVEDINVIWDGSVIAYSLDLNYQGVQQTWAGLWKKDAPQKKLLLNMD
jgi:hypothetical protein